MNNKIVAYLITFIAGISTVLGIIPTFFNKINKDKIINCTLSFSIGVMLTISILSLIPESIKYLNNNFNFFYLIVILIFVNIGIIISSYVDGIISKKIDSNLKKIGIVSIIALILHNIPEGIITYITTSNNLVLGLKLAIAISIHNIPEGIAVAIPLYYSTKKRSVALFYTFISGFSEMFGAILSSIFLSNYINNKILAFILSITAGIMIHISLFELLPTIKKYNNYKHSIMAFIIGVLVIILTLNA